MVRSRGLFFESVNHFLDKAVAFSEWGELVEEMENLVGKILPREVKLRLIQNPANSSSYRYHAIFP